MKYNVTVDKTSPDSKVTHLRELLAQEVDSQALDLGLDHSGLFVEPFEESAQLALRQCAAALAAFRRFSCARAAPAATEGVLQ